MKTNVAIELTDGERDTLANIIAGKVNKRLATRQDVVAICRQHIAGLVATMPAGEDQPPAPGAAPIRAAGPGSDLYHPDPADVPLMARPNDPSYVYGWNKVKRGMA